MLKRYYIMNKKQQNSFLNRLGKNVLKRAKELAIRDKMETVEVDGYYLRKKFREASREL